MERKTWFVGFAAGVLAGVVATIAISGGLGVPRVMAQVPGDQPTPFHAQAILPPPHYQLSSWGHSGAGGIPPSHGAYVLDIRTGQLWRTDDRGELKNVGKPLQE
jgi:hypothetical protein